MKSKVTSLHPEKYFDDTAVIATVISSASGEAKRLQVHGSSQTLEVLAHLSEVPPLKNKDRVLAQVVEGEAVITGRLRQPGENPAYLVHEEEGVLVMKSEKGISLRCGETQIEIRADGQITIHGQDIRQTAAGRFQLQGQTIEFN